MLVVHLNRTDSCVSDVLLWMRLLREELGRAWVTPAFFHFGCDATLFSSLRDSPLVSPRQEGRTSSWPQLDRMPEPAKSAGISIVYGIDYHPPVDHVDENLSTENPTEHAL